MTGLVVLGIVFLGAYFAIRSLAHRGENVPRPARRGDGGGHVFVDGGTHDRHGDEPGDSDGGADAGGDSGGGGADGGGGDGGGGGGGD